MSSKSVREQIEQLIDQYPVVVFSKSHCPYCRTAKKILEKYSLEKECHVLELDQTSQMNEFQDELKKITGDRSVPQIFIGGKSIGDEEDLGKLDKEGNLQSLLEKATNKEK